MTGGIAQVVECLLCKHDVLNSIPSQERKKGREGGRKKRKEGRKEERKHATCGVNNPYYTTKALGKILKVG
jgi:hypothetical protein